MKLPGASSTAPLRSAAALLSLIALLAAACSDAPEVPAVGAAPPLPSASDAGALRASEVAGTRPEGATRRLPQDGLVIEQDGDTLTIFARGVSRFDVLRRLAVRFRFELVDWSEADPQLDVFVDEVPLETALARLIEPTPYTARYERDAETKRNELMEVVLGTPPAEETLRSQDALKEARKASKGETDAERHARSARRYRPRSEAEHRAAMERRALRQARRHAEALEALESEDASAREEAAASGLDPQDPADRERLTGLALHDPVGRVRAEAARQLGFGEAGYELVPGLGDPDPDVVIAVIDALSWSDDPNVIEAVKPLRSHPNEAVRDTAEDALWFLEQLQTKP